MTIANGRCESEPMSCDNAAGSNPRAAFLAGVNVNRTITLCFCISGAAAGNYNLAQPTTTSRPAASIAMSMASALVAPGIRV